MRRRSKRREKMLSLQFIKFDDDNMNSTASHTTSKERAAMPLPARLTLRPSPSSKDASLSSLSSHGAESISRRSPSPVFDPTNLADVVKAQQKKFSSGDRAQSPAFSIPADYYTTKIEDDRLK